MKLIADSRRLAKLLRHGKEHDYDIHGWREVSDLVENYGFTPDELKEIVETNDKQRFEFSEDMQRIRARQGHSVNVDVELSVQEPPEVLFHGTSQKSVESILAEGIKPRNRLHVHLSGNVATAVKVGSRHGKPVVFEVSARQMYDAGMKFYLSRNNVWLTDVVPQDYIKLLP